MMPSLQPSFVNIPLAHRGLHDVSAGRVENAMASFRAAVDAGYGIELDVQLSADGQAMVFHDDTLDRVTDEVGRVRERSAAQLSAITLTGSEDVISTLAEVLAFVDGRVPVLVEIKDQDGTFGDNLGQLEAAVARDVSGYSGDCAVMSFNPHSVAVLKELLPDVPRGLTTEGFPDGAKGVSDEALARLRAIADFDRVGASFISHDRASLDAPRVAELKAAGARILCWTVRSPQQEAESRKIAENITFEGYLADLSA